MGDGQLDPVVRCDFLKHFQTLFAAPSVGEVVRRLQHAHAADGNEHTRSRTEHQEYPPARRIDQRPREPSGGEAAKGREYRHQHCQRPSVRCRYKLHEETEVNGKVPAQSESLRESPGHQRLDVGGCCRQHPAAPSDQHRHHENRTSPDAVAQDAPEDRTRQHSQEGHGGSEPQSFVRLIPFLLDCRQQKRAGLQIHDIGGPSSSAQEHQQLLV
mmetsp:Transcript_14049/g.33134  ORF Transcript_14049/g.33134 Transcript_14049/m.33134 type:complete len:214 (+) Transcript_14049:1201-1842(+)